MEKRVDAGLLLSFYGAMLTRRQREILRLYYEEDLSLSEIAEILHVSRQGTHDAIRRGERRLLEMEKRLGLMHRWARVCDELTACRAALRDGQGAEALDIIDRLLREEEELDGV